MIGDWVLIEDKARIDALEPMYKGPWLVMERKGKSACAMYQYWTQISG